MTDKGDIIGTLMGTITLRDPNPDDVSRAGRPIKPDEPTVREVEEAIVAKLGELGYAANVKLVDTDE